MEVTIYWRLNHSSLWWCSPSGHQEFGLSRYSWVAVTFPGSQPVCLERCKESRQLLVFPLQLQQQICCFSYLRGNRWPSCLHISCALTHCCFSSLKLQQEKKSISRSQPCSYWHGILLSSLSTSPHPCQREADILWWVTPCVGAQMSTGEGGHLVLPAAWSQQCEGPSLGNLSAAPADAKAELNFMANTQADIGHFKDAHKQQEMSFTKKWCTGIFRRKR